MTHPEHKGSHDFQNVECNVGETDHSATMRPPIWPQGTVVSLKELVGCFAQLNDSRGQIESYDTQSEQYIVKLEDTERAVSVNARNLLCLKNPDTPSPARPAHVIDSGTEVLLVNLTVRTDFNGHSGKIDHYDDQSGRYHVQMENTADILKVKPVNLIRKDTAAGALDSFLPGTLVLLTNLTVRMDLNGHSGKIQAFDNHSLRYSVILENTAEIVKVKPTNLVHPPKENATNGDTLSPGTHVLLVNLAVRMHLNGCSGTIDRFDVQLGRYFVTLANSAEVVVVKPLNVTAMKPSGILPPGTEVLLGDLVTRQDLNGQLGRIESYDDQSRRYFVRLETSAVIVMVSPSNLVCTSVAGSHPSSNIFPGTYVSLINLTSRTELNGCFGKIDRFDAPSGRYIVTLDSGTRTVTVKPSNVTQTRKRKAAPSSSATEPNRSGRHGRPMQPDPSPRFERKSWES
jgi:hypothetical protein